VSFDAAAAPERGRMADWAFDQLRAAILEGVLGPDERLSVPALAERLNVSRSPVREAVQRLVREGLAVESPHRGAVVASYSAADLVAVYEIREMLEGLAARLAAEHVDPSLRDELQQVHDRHVETVVSGDHAGHMQSDARFHRLVRQGAANEWLIELLDQISGKIQIAMRSTSVSGGPEQALAEHDAILNAIIDGDPDRAEEAARQHVRRLRGMLQESAQGEQMSEHDG
jgi:DNA-binding GntR family transcriptional regulator